MDAVQPQKNSREGPGRDCMAYELLLTIDQA